MSNQMPTQDVRMPAELKPSIGAMFTPEEIVEGCDYAVFNVPRPILLCIAPGAYVYYPAGQHNVPLMFEGDYFIASGAQRIGPHVFLEPGYDGINDDDSSPPASSALGKTLAALLRFTPTGPDATPYNEFYMECQDPNLDPLLNKDLDPCLNPHLDRCANPPTEVWWFNPERFYATD